MVAKSRRGREALTQPQTKQENNRGLSTWVWALIGAAAGAVVWILVRLISGLIGG